jgi:hypothetical protein
VADLTNELRAWPQDTWAKVGVHPDQVAQAVIGCWQAYEVTGLQVDDLNFEEARSLTRPPMTYVRAQLRGRLTARLGRAYQRWLHPTSRRPGDRVPVAVTPGPRPWRDRRVSAGARNPGQPPLTAAAEPSGVSAAGSAAVRPQQRGGHGGRTPTASHVRPAGTVTVGVSAHRSTRPAGRTPRRTPQRSHCTWPLCATGSDTDRRCEHRAGTPAVRRAASGPVGVHRHNDQRT